MYGLFSGNKYNFIRNCTKYGPRVSADAGWILNNDVDDDRIDLMFVVISKEAAAVSAAVQYC